jgi:opacity protein-like surface antigen
MMMKLLLTVCFFLLTSIAAAQDGVSSNKHDVKVIAGASAFLDEDIPFDHLVIGGAFSFHMTERLSVEPQMLYMNGPDSDRDLVLMGNVFYELAAGNRYSIYVVGGAGILNHKRRFGTSTFSANEVTGNGGLGVKVFLTKNVFIAPEFRFGWEPFMTAQAAFGYSF